MVLIYQADMPFEDDLIEVETPERVELKFPIAGLGSRFAAVCLDWLIIIVILILLQILFAYLFMAGLSIGEYTSSYIKGLNIIVSFVVFNGYFIFFEYMWNGQTPGKRATRIRVMKLGGVPVDLSSAMIRNLMRLIDIILFGLTIGFFILFMSKLSQRPGDYVAGTLVVRDSYITLADLDRYLEIKQDTTIKDQVVDKRFLRLNDADAQLIYAFMERRHKINPAQRKDFADRIAAGLRNKLKIRDDEFETPELLIRFAYEALKQKKGDW
jgi:uncharacterized RDD family membrane protein YckC